jgi:hypothetical protein
MRTVAITLTKEFDNKANAESALEYIETAAEARGWNVKTTISE